MKKFNTILLTLTLILGLTGCSSKVETTSIKQIVEEYKIANDTETIDAFKSIDITNTKSHSCKFKDGSGYFKVNDGTNSYTANVENFMTLNIEQSNGEIVVDLTKSNKSDNDINENTDEDIDENIDENIEVNDKQKDYTYICDKAKKLDKLNMNIDTKDTYKYINVYNTDDKNIQEFKINEGISTINNKILIDITSKYSNKLYNKYKNKYYINYATSIDLLNYLSGTVKRTDAELKKLYIQASALSTTNDDIGIDTIYKCLYDTKDRTYYFIYSDMNNNIGYISYKYDNNKIYSYRNDIDISDNIIKFINLYSK